MGRLEAEASSFEPSMKPVVFPEPLWAVAEAPAPAPAKQPLPAWGFIEWFVIGQTALPALLFFAAFQPLRLPIRIGAFGASLVALALAWWLGRARRHPSSTWLLFALAYLVLMIFHPATNTRLAGLAQGLLYLSVLAPAFWAPAMVRSAAHLRRLLWLLLILNGINSAVGVLQVYDPGTWMPRELTSLEGSGVVAIRLDRGSQAKVLSYKGNNGETVVRPPGLFDSPGAVAGPGMYAGLIGLTFFVTVPGVWKKGVALFFSLMGVSVIYLTQVRTSLIVLGGMLLVYIWALLVRKRVTQATALLGVAAALMVGAFSLAITLGGGTIRDRVATLWSKNPADLYYANRGNQLENGFTTLLIEHPFGAGLARWGMMRHYFGDPGNLNSPPIWAEVQFPAWILDGGFVLALLYSTALITSLWQAVVLILRAPSEQVSTAAALVLAVNAGTVALTFGFTPFTTQHGLQYWLLSGALLGVAQGSRGAAGRA
jgi:hypothetical protein